MAIKRDFVVKNGLVVTEDIELGHVTDTTIARSSAGVITVEGVVVPTVSSTSTLTNKTLTAPVINIGSDAEGDIYYRTSGGAFTRLARGSDNQTLMMNGNVPNWETVSGGGGGIASLAADTTPQLGGDLDVDGNEIVSTSNAAIDITPHGTGDVQLNADNIRIGDSNADVTITPNFSKGTKIEMQTDGDLLVNADTSSGNLYMNAYDLVSIQSNYLRIGKNNADMKITTLGTGDLTLNTNNGTNSGSIVIADGANGNIDVNPNGSGKVRINTTSGDGVKLDVRSDNNATVANFRNQTSITNAAQTVIQLICGTSGTAAAGLGAKLQFRQGDDPYAGYAAGSIYSSRVDNSNHDLVIAPAGTGQVTISAQMTSRANVVAASSGGGNTLTQAQSGSYVYWTAGSLTLPADAAVGSQFTIFNNTGSSATVALGSGDAMAGSWASNAAVADNDATSYVCVNISSSESQWVQVGA